MTQSGLVIEIEETGEQWSGVTEWSINEAFDVETDEWSATVYDQDNPVGLRRKFLPKSRVKLYVDGALQVIGRIEMTSDVQKSSALRIMGYDYLADLVGPNMDESVRIGGGMTLADALKLGLKPYGITEIETSIAEVMNRKIGKATITETRPFSYRNELNPVREAYINAIEPGLQESVRSFNPDTEAFIDALPTKKRATYEEVHEHRPQSGQGVLQWANDLCARVGGYSIQPGTRRNAIAVVKPDFSQTPILMLKRPEGNVVSATARRDWRRVPTVASLRCRRITTELKAENEWATMSAVDDPNLEFGKIEEVQRILENARTVKGRIPRINAGKAGDYYCPIYIRDDEARTKEHLQNSGRRMLGDRFKSTLEYMCTLRDYRIGDGGPIITSNIMAHVADNVSDVNEPLWIRERTIGYQRGSRCELSMIRPGSFVL